MPALFKQRLTWMPTIWGFLLITIVIIFGIIATDSLNYDKYQWWKTSSGAKSVLTETIGLMWITCYFNPGEKHSHQEKWGEHITPP